MGARGFVFSMDAFVAFVLTTVIIGLIIFAAGMPRAYYDELEQAHQLAHGTLFALSKSFDPDGGQTYLSGILSGGGSAGEILRRVAGGDPEYSGIIPKGYGYVLEKRNFDEGAWVELYDSMDDEASDRFGKGYTKLQASATVLVSLYDPRPDPGQSPFCYKSCYGYGLDEGKACNVTPCDPPISNFMEGKNTVQLVRLTVYT